MREFFKVKMSNYKSPGPPKAPKLATADRFSRPRINKVPFELTHDREDSAEAHPYKTEHHYTETSNDKIFSETFQCGTNDFNDSAPLKNPLSQFRRMPKNMRSVEQKSYIVKPCRRLLESQSSQNSALLL